MRLRIDKKNFEKIYAMFRYVPFENTICRLNPKHCIVHQQKRVYG